MPDPRVPLGAVGGDGGGRSGGPLQTLGALMQVKEKHNEYLMKQRELEDDDAARDALSRYDRPDDALEDLWKQGRHGAASKLGQSIYEERAAKLKEYDARLTAHGTALGQAAQILQGVSDDASYQTARGAVVKLVQPIYGDAINDYLPTVYGDGTQVKQLVKAGTSRAANIQQEHNAVVEQNDAINKGLMRNPRSVEFRPDGSKNPDYDPNVGAWSPNGLEAQSHYRNALSIRLSLAENKEQWDKGLIDAHDNGTPISVIHEFGPWRAGAKEHAEQLGMTQPQRAAAVQDSVRAATAAVAATTSSIRARTAAEAEARRARAAAAGTGGVTEGQRRNEEDERDTEDQKIETWLQEQWKEKGVGDFRYENLKDAAPNSALAGMRDEYVRRRLQNWNKRRQRLQNLPPIEQAARQAAKQGDLGGYQKLREEYGRITQGLGTLDTKVKPPAGDWRAELADVLKKLETETNPGEIAKLERRRDELSRR